MTVTAPKTIALSADGDPEELARYDLGIEQVMDFALI